MRQGTCAGPAGRPLRREEPVIPAYHGEVRTVVPTIVILALLIYALTDCLRTPDRSMKTLPKGLWLATIVLIPVIGPVAWLVAGKVPHASGGQRRIRRDGPLAPDDDPAFLKKLDDQRWSERMRRQREKRTDDPGGHDDDTPEPTGS